MTARDERAVFFGVKGERLQVKVLPGSVRWVIIITAELGMKCPIAHFPGLAGILRATHDLVSLVPQRLTETTPRPAGQ
jgi:hypothetical protein